MNLPSEMSILECSLENKRLNNRNFWLIISKKIGTHIKPVVIQYTTRRYLKLKAGEWSTVFALKIWEQTKIPCAFKFKNATVFPSYNAQCFVRFNGICIECKATLHGKMLKKPNDKQDAIFDCILTGFSSQIMHRRRRQKALFVKKLLTA